MIDWAHSPVITIAALILGAVFVIWTIKTKSYQYLIPSAWVVCYSVIDVVTTGLDKYTDYSSVTPYAYLIACSAIFFIVCSLKANLLSMARVFMLLCAVNVASGIMAYFLSKYYYDIGQGLVDSIWGWYGVAYFITTLTMEVYLFILGYKSARINPDRPNASGDSFRA